MFSINTSSQGLIEPLTVKELFFKRANGILPLLSTRLLGSLWAGAISAVMFCCRVVAPCGPTDRWWWTSLWKRVRLSAWHISARPACPREPWTRPRWRPRAAVWQRPKGACWSAAPGTLARWLVSFRGEAELLTFHLWVAMSLLTTTIQYSNILPLFGTFGNTALWYILVYSDTEQRLRRLTSRTAM